MNARKPRFDLAELIPTRAPVPQDMAALGWYATGSREDEPLLSLLQGAKAAIEVANAALANDRRSNPNVRRVLDSATRQLDAAEVLFGKLKDWGLSKIAEGEEENPYLGAPKKSGRK